MPNHGPKYVRRGMTGDVANALKDVRGRKEGSEVRSEEMHDERHDGET